MAVLVLFPLVVCLALAASTAYCAVRPPLCRFSGLIGRSHGDWSAGSPSALQS